MCPTCRQRTYLENVAFVVEKQSENVDKQAEDLAESAISVQGSHGTKVSFIFLTYDHSICCVFQIYCFLTGQKIKKSIVSSYLSFCNNLTWKVAGHALVQHVTFSTNQTFCKTELLVA